MRKWFMLFASAYILFIGIFILFFYVKPMSEFVDPENQEVVEIPEGLKKYISEAGLENIIVETREIYNGFSDGYGVYIIKYSIDADELILNKEDWERLPFVEEDFTRYIEICFGWPLENYDDLHSYDLTNEGCRGYWRFYAEYIDYNGNRQQLPATDISSIGLHEIILVLEDEKQMFYVYTD